MNTLPDFAALLNPIAPENPAGEDLEYGTLFDEIRAARESDPHFLPQDEWAVSEPRKADWNRVRLLCEQALVEQSKDLQLACWLVESLGHQQGLSGLIAGVGFLDEFIMHFWFQCWPSLEDEGGAIRRGRLVRLDRDISQQLFSQPLLKQAGSSLSCWKQILAFEHKISAAPDRRDDLIAQEGDLTMATFDRQAAQFSASEIGQQTERVEALAAALVQLNADYLSRSQDPDGELFTQTRQMLVDIADYLQRLAQRAISPVDTLPPMTPDDSKGADEAEVAVACRHTQAMDRELAVSQMLAIARYFRQTEPSSPVPFLMERAARWANMTLTEWLDEMLTDSSSMRDITHVLTGQTTS
ncbi:type VI secretion system protein TssA [Pseudescherichia sp.]|uniref:type VI secretion system protein TssA n=1 Tax=Pseudescherichia sp. TaxID=2055881 RepID=UPI002896C77F|nr:type VI secretion system protein TssA [Pseudescherichia sp.]